MENKEKIEGKENMDDIRVRIFAVLDDLSGKKYYLQTDDGGYIWVDSDLVNYEKVDEAMVYSAILKHGYKKTDNSTIFTFKDREKFL